MPWDARDLSAVGVGYQNVTPGPRAGRRTGICSAQRVAPDQDCPTLEDKHWRDRSTPLWRYVPKRARKDLDVVQAKRARVVELRGQGWTWDRIAAEVGYSNGSAASKAWRAAIRQHPDQTVDEIRFQQRTRLEQMDSRLSDLITSPPLKTTAIGRVLTDPETGEPVRDMGAAIAAIRERRQIGESLRRLTGADTPPSRSDGLNEDQVRLMAEVIVARRDRGLHAALPPAPDGYRDLTPEQQARADLERHRARLAAVPLDIVEAEIVDD